MENGEDDLIERAIQAFIRYEKRTIGEITQASRDLSEVVRDKIILRNVNGELARYRVYRSGKIRKMDSSRAN
jgi:hypothetical protein